VWDTAQTATKHPSSGGEQHEKEKKILKTDATRGKSSRGPARFGDGETKNKDKQRQEETEPTAHRSKSNWTQKRGQHTWVIKLGFFIENQQEYNQSTEVTVLPTSFS
jgi:hypothetical protein